SAPGPLRPRTRSPMTAVASAALDGPLRLGYRPRLADGVPPEASRYLDRGAAGRPPEGDRAARRAGATDVGRSAGGGGAGGADRRVREGWQYGTARDDELKRHPDLVPYDELPESEKEYDRSVAMHSVKTVLALGYRIESPEHRNGHDATVELALRRLRGAERLGRSDLIGLWRSLTAPASPPPPHRFILPPPPPPAPP